MRQNITDTFFKLLLTHVHILIFALLFGMGLPWQLSEKLQKLQNCAARVVTNWNQVMIWILPIFSAHLARITYQVEA